MLKSTMMPHDHNTEPPRRDDDDDDEGRRGHHHHHRHKDQQLETAEFQIVYHQVLSNARSSSHHSSILSKQQHQQWLKPRKESMMTATASTTTTTTAVNDVKGAVKNVITEYTVRDILSGRGGLANKHAGNRVYRRLIDLNKPLYRKLTTKTRKSQLVESILRAIYNHGGRFLKQTKNHNKTKTNGNKQTRQQWFEIDYASAFVKTSQALREPTRSSIVADASKQNKTSSSPASFAFPRTSAGTTEASSSSTTTTDNDDDDDEEAGTDYSDDDDDDDIDVLNPLECGVELNDEDMAMLLRASSSTALLRRGSSTLVGDWFPETDAGEPPCVSAASAAAAASHNLSQDQERYTSHYQHNHRSGPLGMPTTGDLLDESDGAARAFSLTSIHSPITTTSKTKAACSSKSESSSIVMCNKHHSAQASPVLAASLLQHLAANTAVDYNNNVHNNVSRASLLQLPPIPQSLSHHLRMDTSRRALDHLLTNNHSNDADNCHYHQHQTFKTNDDNMPAPLDPLSRMTSSTAFSTAALDAILLRQDSLDFSVYSSAHQGVSSSSSNSMKNTELQQQQYEHVNFEAI
jgi:hypothetical protein